MPRAPSRLKLTADGKDTLLRFLARRGGIPEEEARAAIARGAAFLRGRRVREPLAEVRTGDRVEVTLRESAAVALGKERVLHLDDQVLAVDKPAGVAAQEDLAGGAALPLLCEVLLGKLGEEETQALLVHRLDRGTTGATVLARTKQAQAALLEEFRAHRVGKEYRALVSGAPAADEGVIDLALGAGKRGLRRLDPQGESALTRYRVLERYQGAALISAAPATGRTHQIRVHLAALGCPLLGDVRYCGPAFLTRQDGSRLECARPLLHALSLSLRHPDGSQLSLAAPSPADFEEACTWLRQSR